MKIPFLGKRGVLTEGRKGHKGIFTEGNEGNEEEPLILAKAEAIALVGCASPAAILILEPLQNLKMRIAASQVGNLAWFLRFCHAGVTMPRRIRALLLAAVVITALAMLALVVLKPGPPARPPLPNPNGYDDFIRAGQAVTDNVGNYANLGRESLSDLVSTNAEALRLLRIGLARPCLMPIDAALTNATGMIAELTAAKRLTRLLAAEGRLAELENRPADAARSYTDAIHFGNEISRGGMLITRLVGIACESIGCHALVKIVPNLNPNDSRTAVAELERVDFQRVTWTEVLRNERYYARHQTNRLNPILSAIAWLTLWQTRQKAEARQNTIVAHERLLMADLAVRCYQSERGHVPARLDELVPNLLAKIPQDPFSGRPMVYQPQGTNCLLYSVGPDGVDNGGKPAGRGLGAKGDLFFDSSW